jgi:hypothetical protein
MRLVIDMYLTPRWVQRLTEGGLEALHWSAPETRQRRTEKFALTPGSTDT